MARTYNMSDACTAAEDIILNDFRTALRETILEEAVEEYRKRIIPIVDANLKTVLDARVEAVRMVYEDTMDLNINVKIM